MLAVDLVRELAKSIPERCIRKGETPEDAHRYAGQRDLVNHLLMRLEATEKADPAQPLVPKE
jgi:hypothetical protein